MAKARCLTAEHPELGTLFAAFQPGVHRIAGRVTESRFAARLAPFKTETEARSALVDAGCPEVVHGTQG